MVGVVLTMLRKILVVLSVLLLCIGCGNSKEKQARELASQADKYHQDNDLTSAIDVYEKSLELHEDAAVREKMRLVKQEQEAVAEAKRLLETIKNAKTSLYMPENDEQILDALKEIQKSLINLGDIEAPKGTEIYNFISTLDDKNEYYRLKMRTDLIVVNFQFLDGDADIKEYETIVDDFLKMASFIDVYK
ncbi:MAG TPA: hypothetical protein V6C99_07930 [Oculatellaceae cyanobacterium]